MSDSAHIFFYLGSDELAIRKQVDGHAAMFSDPTSAGMNTSRMDTKIATESDLSNAVGAMPFLAPRRFVVLENVSKRYTGLDGHKKFIAFLETVPAFTCLVVPEIAEIKPKELNEHWLVKWVAKNSEKAEFKSFMLPDQKQMAGWIIAEAKRQKGSIEPAAAARLAEMTGNNTRQAAQEITKLLTYVNYAHTISLEEVEDVSIVTASVSIFDLVDELGARNGKRAQYLFHRLLEEKDAFEVFGMIVRQFRLIIMARDLIDENMTQAEVTAALHLHPYVADKVCKQTSAFDMQSLDAVYHRLLSIDEAAKTGGMGLDASLDMLIVELSGKK